MATPARGTSTHPVHDIIPPFAVIQSGTTFFPGQNMGSLYGAGFTGAEVLANNCDIPTGARPAVTTTVISTTTATVPGTTITVPPETQTKGITVTVTAPAETTTAPGTTTIVTLPSNVTTTVTLPERTVTSPAVTHTIAGETIERDASTVTLAGTTVTVTAGATTTVVTVTGANKVVRAGVLGTKHAQVTLTTPKRVVRVGARVIHVLGKGRLEGKKVIVVVVRSNGCPAGTALYNGECRAVVRGQG